MTIHIVALAHEGDAGTGVCWPELSGMVQVVAAFGPNFHAKVTEWESRKSEIRNPKQTRMGKLEIGQIEHRFSRFPVSSFQSFGFVSDFGFFLCVDREL